MSISTADRLPASQRGKVAGLTGFATQVAPVLGVGPAGGLAGSNLPLFLAVGSAGGEKNHTLRHAVRTVAGGLVVLRIRSVR